MSALDDPVNEGSQKKVTVVVLMVVGNGGKKTSAIAGCCQKHALPQCSHG